MGFPVEGDQLYNAELMNAKKLGIQMLNPQQIKIKDIFDPKIELQTMKTALIQLRDN